MKKIVFSAMSLALVILLVSGNALFAESKNLKIAMIQWRGETEACRGFRDEMKALGYSVQYTVLNASPVSSYEQSWPNWAAAPRMSSGMLITPSAGARCQSVAPTIGPRS